MKQYRRFISFEGIDYAGKTTQLKLLRERLQNAGITAQLLREPGGTDISEKIRHILLDKAHLDMHAKTEILLYAAARAQLVHQKIIPELEKGAYILADRFFDSTTVYQGYGRKLDLQFVEALNAFATSGLTPFKTILLDISPDVALQRRQDSGRTSDRLDAESRDFYQTIYEAYHQLVKKHPNRFIVVSAEREVSEIAEEIWEKISKLWQIS